MEGSRQGINIAFVGLNQRAQTACADYLKTNRGFTRMDLDDPLKRFIRTTYDARPRQRMQIYTRLAFYDALYREDPELFIRHMQARVPKVQNDIVVSNVRYLNELKGLQDLGFHAVRVTTTVNRLQPEQILKTAGDGTLGIALKYDRDFAGNQNVPHTIHWTSRANTKYLVDSLLENLGYEI